MPGDYFCGHYCQVEWMVEPLKDTTGVGFRAMKEGVEKAEIWI